MDDRMATGKKNEGEYRIKTEKRRKKEGETVKHISRRIFRLFEERKQEQLKNRNERTPRR